MTGAELPLLVAPQVVGLGVPTDLISRSRVAELLTAARGVRVAVIGDAMLDVYLHGDTERVSPEAPVPIVRVRERREALGGAANVAQNVIALNAHCTLVGAVGRDASAERLGAMLSGMGAPTSGLITVTRPTTTKTRVLARSQQLLRFDEEDDGELDGAESARILDGALAAVAEADAVILEDYNKGVLTRSVIHSVIDAAKKKGAPIVVDPKYRNFFEYRGATVFKPNRREMDAAYGAKMDLEQADVVHRAYNEIKADYLLLTLGARGMKLLSPAPAADLVIPTTAREVYDVVGAGDTVTAYLAAMLAAKATAMEASVISNFAAGVEVGKLGAQVVTADEVLAAYDEHHASTTQRSS